MQLIDDAVQHGLDGLLRVHIAWLEVGLLRSQVIHVLQVLWLDVLQDLIWKEGLALPLCHILGVEPHHGQSEAWRALWVVQGDIDDRSKLVGLVPLNEGLKLVDDLALFEVLDVPALAIGEQLELHDPVHLFCHLLHEALLFEELLDLQIEHRLGYEPLPDAVDYEFGRDRLCRLDVLRFVDRDEALLRESALGLLHLEIEPRPVVKPLVDALVGVLHDL